LEAHSIIRQQMLDREMAMKVECARGTERTGGAGVRGEGDEAKAKAQDPVQTTREATQIGLDSGKGGRAGAGESRDDRADGAESARLQREFAALKLQLYG
jgi:hypothetical protein